MPVLLSRGLPYLNEAFMITSALLVGAGWFAIRRRRVHLHRRLMLSGALAAVLFFVSYAVRSLVVGDTTFGGPRSLAAPYQVFLQVHTILATVAAVLGILTIRWALRRRFGQHRRVAPWTAVLWFVAAGSGLMVFLMLYILYPPGPTTNILRAVVGH